MQTTKPPPSPTQRFNSVFTRKASRRASFVGIDIGVQEVRVATLGFQSGDKSTQRLHWKSKFRFESQTGGPAEPSPEWIQGIVDTLLTRLPRCVDGETQLTAISIPISWTLYQTVPFDGHESAKSESDEVFTQSIFNSRSHTAQWPVVSPDAGDVTDHPFILASVSEQLACQLVSSICELGYKV